MGIFDKIKRGKSAELAEIYANCLSQNDFRAAVVTERKRSERSSKPFLLLLLDFTQLCTSSKNIEFSSGEMNLSASFEKFIELLGSSLRGIDVMGWYDRGKILGMIFPETDLSSKDALLDKVRAHLNFALGERRSSLIGMHCFCFPAANNTCDGEGAQTQNERDELYFYPESENGSVSQMISCGLKRLLDISGSLFGLTLFLPFFIIIPLLIKFDSDGPVFFCQKRVGFNGRTFTFLKFRSMYIGRDDSLHRDYVKKLIHDGAASQTAQSDGSGAVYKITNDPRVTAVGRFLRRTSLDELPQFINVFLGQMSLVGPRPAIPYETQEYELWHRCRILDVKPGITGIWQVEGRSRTTFEEMVRMDMRYCRSKSFWLDLKLIFKTPFALIGARGAF
ncbi:MAG: sugar transferase [Chitinispirillia bacterium]|nr:sugar transferase [Chitinispirillia bacterium]